MGRIYEGINDLNLKEGAPVVLLPQGYLRLLPLHAAWRWVNGKKRTFLDEYTVSYGPSAFGLWYSREQLKTHREGDSTLLVVDAMPEFRQSADECNIIANLFPQDTVVKLDSKNATKENVITTAKNKDYIHFSCHGLYRWDDAMESNLALFQNEKLTLADILSSLKLGNNRLISLSACESGFTDVVTVPEEFIGLPGGFMQAGAPCMISSLWAVDVDATYLLMTRFYICHRKKGLSPAQALRSAQIFLRDLTRNKAESLSATKDPWAVLSALLAKKSNDRPFENPFYWAAFTVYGF